MQRLDGVGSRSGRERSCDRACGRGDRRHGHISADLCRATSPLRTFYGSL
jgi:hypothetical protein